MSKKICSDTVSLNLSEVDHDNLYQYTHILFDLDGTLIDSSACAVMATQNAFSKYGLSIPLSKQIIHFMGVPIEISFKEMGASHLTDTDFNMLLATFREYYKVSSQDYIKSFPNAEQCLSYLKQQGQKIAIVTSKKTDVAIYNLKQLKIDHYIDFIIGSDKVNHPKPDPESIMVALQHFNIAPQNYKNVIMIGDATFDIKMGQAMNIDTCAVTWGAHRIDMLKETQPTYIANDFTDLLDILNQKIIECPFKST